MAEDSIIQPSSQPEAPKEQSRAEERITQLSDKLRQESEAKAAAEAKALAAERKAAFAEGFVDVMSAHPAAKDHKADIEAKVLSGMSVEDAAYAVLGRAGKLGSAPVAAPFPAPTQVAGGSAVTNPPQSGDKSLAEMSTAEKRAALEKLLVIS